MDATQAPRDRIEPIRHPGASLHLPSADLAGCIYAAAERDTRELPPTPRTRVNIFPASPLSTLSWIFDGTLHIAGVETGPLPRMTFSGPTRRPTVSWSQGAVHAMSVSLFPDALTRLFGIRAVDYLDQTLQATEVIPSNMATEFLAVESFEDLEAVIRRWWSASDGGARNFHEWVTRIAIRAERSRLGTSLRQVQRRIKDLTGHSRRELLLLARAEEAFARRQHTSDLATVAADSGYADQSHLGRDVKRITGYSPGRIIEHIESDEAFWLYRLLADYHASGRSGVNAPSVTTTPGQS